MDGRRQSDRVPLAANDYNQIPDEPAPPYSPANVPPQPPPPPSSGSPPPYSQTPVCAVAIRRTTIIVARCPQENVPDYLCWSIVNTLMCCFFMGLAAIRLSMATRCQRDLGNIEGAKATAKSALVMNIFSTVFGIMAIIAIIAFHVSSQSTDVSSYNDETQYSNDWNEPYLYDEDTYTHDYRPKTTKTTTEAWWMDQRTNPATTTATTESPWKRNEGENLDDFTVPFWWQEMMRFTTKRPSLWDK